MRKSWIKINPLGREINIDTRNETERDEGVHGSPITAGVDRADCEMARRATVLEHERRRMRAVAFQS